MGISYIEGFAIMVQKAPRQSCRKGITIMEIFEMFPDNTAAENWFMSIRWPDGIRCPSCGSSNVQIGTKHKTMPFRCRNYKECGKKFSVKTGSLMEGSNLGYQVWAIAIYLLTTSVKSVSSMKLHRDLSITQKSAWHLARRVRKSIEEGGRNFNRIVEIDEIYADGLEKNKHWDKILNAGDGGGGKSIVSDVKDRGAKLVTANIVENTKRPTLHGFINMNVEKGSNICTDDFMSHEKMREYDHHSVKQSVGEYVDENIQINGMESFWGVLKWAHKCTFHKIRHKHLDWYVYVTEFAGKHNARPMDTIKQMERIVRGMVGKPIAYKDLVA